MKDSFKPKILRIDDKGVNFPPFESEEQTILNLEID
jgi:hypothetical protein